MNEILNKDVIIKDEGKFYEVFFNTLKAKEIANSDMSLKGNLINVNDLVSIEITKTSKNKMINYCVSHDLSVFEF